MTSLFSRPLGATVDKDGVQFAVFASHAERVQLCLFAEDGTEHQQVDFLQQDSGVWHHYMPGLKPGQRYGYRVFGPYAPESGYFHNEKKLLLDPYAKQLTGAFAWHGSLRHDRPEDSAPYVPKCVVVPPMEPLRQMAKIPWEDTIFYEANVRGFTMSHPALDAKTRGRFSGMRHREVLNYLKALGVTSVELQPVFAYIDEAHLAEKGLRNFWGYNTLSFFAPMPRFAGESPVFEFRDMVSALHDAGLEVILDVAYNHTAEGSAGGPTLSFRGLDNLAYYRMESDSPGSYINDTGCGNTTNADSPVFQQLVMDSLCYWVETMGVDGFRFDLAPVLGRHREGFSTAHPLLQRIVQHPRLQDIKMVAEPWDPGPGGYQLGQFPKGFAEWNDQFRDVARRFWRGDDEQTGALARHVHGSAHLFEASGREPSASVNLVTTHDGFTLFDLAAFESKHNLANGEENRDGHNHNHSINFGVEGQTNDPSINEKRRAHRLNLLATTFVAQGTPLLLAGDEFGNSQGGNNNAYAQDNATGWLNWEKLESDRDFFQAVKEIIALRKDISLLRLDRHVHGSFDNDNERVAIRWFNPNGEDRADHDWSFGHAFGKVLTRFRGGVLESGVVIVFNAWQEPIDFVLPVLPENWVWTTRFSTTDCVSCLAETKGLFTVAVPAGTLMVLVAR